MPFLTQSVLERKANCSAKAGTVRATSTDAMGEVRGLSFESYGKLVWSTDEMKFAVKTGLKDSSPKA